MSFEDLKEFTKNYETNRASIIVANWLGKASQEQFNQAYTEMSEMEYQPRNAEEERWYRVFQAGLTRYLLTPVH